MKENGKQTGNKDLDWEQNQDSGESQESVVCKADMPEESMLTFTCNPCRGCEAKMKCRREVAKWSNV